MTAATHPDLTRAILYMPTDAANALLGIVAGHFATAEVLDAETLRRYVAEAEAVSKP